MEAVKLTNEEALDLAKAKLNTLAKGGLNESGAILSLGLAFRFSWVPKAIDTAMDARREAVAEKLLSLMEAGDWDGYVVGAKAWVTDETFSREGMLEVFDAHWENASEALGDDEFFYTPVQPPAENPSLAIATPSAEAEIKLNPNVTFHPSDLAKVTIEEKQRWIEELADLYSTDPLTYVEKRKDYAKRLATTNEALDKAVKLVRDRRHEEQARLDQEAKADAKDHRFVRRNYDKCQQCVDPKSFMELAEHFLASAHIDEASGHRTLHWYDRNFYSWNGTKYSVKSHDSLRADLYMFLPKLWTKPQGSKTNATLERLQASTDLVYQVTEALKARANLDTTVAPFWIEIETACPYGEIKELLSCSNGILHIPTKVLYPHSPLFFTLNSIGYAYDPEAPKPKKWLSYLKDIFPDPQSVACVQEIFGLCLTEETKYQKGFIAKGPTRSGKGTIFSKILPAIIGHGSFVGKSLNQLATNFGRRNLVGKKVMVAPDARMEPRKKITITELLLSIIGEDPLSHDRKYNDEWEGVLTTKVVICTNELPAFNDNTGVIAGRFIILVMTKSFFGKEDLNLAEKLLQERASILEWAIDGYLRLRQRGHFIQPEAGKECMRDLKINASQILSFTNDRCEFCEATTDGDKLYLAYTSWCRKNGVFYVLDRNHFGRQLLDACPQVTTSRPRKEEGRPTAYVGLRVQPKGDENLFDYKTGKPK